MKVTLKPCPFCGGTPKREERISEGGYIIHHIICFTCYASVYGAYMGTATLRWNRRVKR